MAAISTAPGCSRRGFLRTVTAGTLAGGSRAGTCSPATPGWRPRFILASALYGTFPLEAVLPEVARTGAALLDLWPRPHGSQREEVDLLGVERVREMLAGARVRLGGIACYKVGAFNLAGEFAVATQLGGEGVVLVCTAPGDGRLLPADLDAAIAAFFDRLRPSLAAAAAAGGVIAIENHSQSLLQTADGIRRFADALPSDHVGVALAPHHLPQDPALVAAVARDLGPRLKFVYAQAAAPRAAGPQPQPRAPRDDELLQLPGRGPFDFGPLMRTLAANEFAGPVEIFMHPTSRGVPIRDTVAAISAEVDRARRHLEALLP